MRDAAGLLLGLWRVAAGAEPGTCDTTSIAASLGSQFGALGVPTRVFVVPNGRAAHFIAWVSGDGSP